MSEETKNAEAGGGEAASIALAGASRAESDAFLREQRALAADQRHHLHQGFKQIGLRLWELRMGVALRIATLIVGIAAAAGLGLLVWDAAHSRGLIIEPFNVPPDLATRGQTGEVVASQLIDKLTAMSKRESARAAQSYANNWGNNVKVEIPETGVSIGELRNFLRDWLGHDIRISGEVYKTPDGIAVNVRTSGGDQGATFTGKETDLGALVQKAAEHVYQVTQPYRYANYLDRNFDKRGADQRVAKARAIYWQLIAGDDSKERAWAWNGLGTLATNFDGEWDKSVYYYRKALEEDPQSLIAIFALSARPLAQGTCHLGPPSHEKGPRVFMDYDQVDLDAAYTQIEYEPNLEQVRNRLASTSAAVRGRIGNPQRVSYGPTEVEKLDIYCTKRPNAPIFVFIHGGSWLLGTAQDNGYPAEMFVNAGAHYVVLDFIAINPAGGDLGVMAAQVRRAIAWVYKNAKSFGGDAKQLYIGGHSSGGHLCGVALVTDWRKEFGIPADCIRGGLCMSGMYEMKPVRLSVRSTFVKFTDAMEDAMSSQRHIDMLRAPITVTYGTLETPEFQRQNRDFAAAVKAAGKPVKVVEAANYAHLEMAESLGNPYGPNGRAALEMMQLNRA